MENHDPGPPVLDPAPTTSRKKGQALVAWAVILAIVGLVLFAQEYRDELAGSEEGTTSAGVDLVIFELQSRYLVGAKHVIAAQLGQAEAAKLAEQVESFNRGSIEQRLRYLAVAREMRDVDLAHVAASEATALRETVRRNGRQLTPEQERVVALLEREDLASLPANERQYLVDQLGWFGELAARDRSRDDIAEPPLAQAIRTFAVVVIGFVAAVGLTLVGAMILVIALTLPARYQWEWRFQPGPLGHGAVYAEAFALWFLLYFLLQVALSLAAPQLPLLARAGVGMLASLAAVSWPVLRGISWTQVRKDLGWTRGEGILRECAAGVAVYVANLPVVLVGVALMLALTVGFKLVSGQEGGGEQSLGASDVPGHPILRYLRDGNLDMLLQIYVLAAVIAPLVEETVFRGMLYRQMRESTSSWPGWASRAASALAVCVLFALVHPQGVFAVPVLTALALGFCFTREWRDSLIGAIFAHGLNNATVVTLAALALSP